MTETVLDRRTLNRTLLSRQLLLERARWAAADVIEHLVGMQAQEPMDPYISLWSRIDGFAPADLVELLEGRRAVRANTLWRTTIHLVTAADAPMMRALTQPLVERTFRRTDFGRNLEGLDLAEVVATGRAALSRRPLTGVELGTELAAHWPDRDAGSLAQAVRWLLPTVQVPPRAIWGRSGPPTLAPLETWLDCRLPEAARADEVVLRYLAAFGPASVADLRSWSGLAGLRQVVDRLDDRLRRYRDENGRVLLDLADAELAGPDLPAPVRFFGNYDNLFLGHADRTRIVPPAARESTAFPFGGGGTWVGSFTLDGFGAGAWRLNRTGDHLTLVIRPALTLTGSQLAEIEVEGRALAGFVFGGQPDLSVELG